MIKSDNINEIYQSICSKLVNADRIGNTHELNNMMIQLTDINNNIVGIRNLSPSYLFGELLWYFTGQNSLEFISKFSSFWKHLSDDGKTSNSAYGYLLMHKHGFNQIDKIIELLKKDPSSRRAVLNINVPNEKVIETKDEPCTIALQFLIRDNALHCTAIMRSNDIWFGFPYDVAFFTELQKYIADNIGVNYGTYTHFATSLHLYDKDFDSVTNIVNNPICKEIHFNGKVFHKYKYELFNEICKSNNPKEDIVTLFKSYGIYNE